MQLDKVDVLNGVVIGPNPEHAATIVTASMSLGDGSISR